MGKKNKQRLPESQSSVVSNFVPRTEKQEILVDLIEEREVVVAVGPPGTGKTYVALATALQLLGEKYKNIILVKSLTTIPGESLGFLPGDEREKMEPYLMSFTWNIDKILGDKNAAKSLIDKKIVEILPLAFIRGISIDNSIVIIDETQNIDSHTFKTLMTRIGENSKYIFLGDVEQIDRKKKEESCLEKVLDIFHDDPIIGTLKFDDSDCVRNKIIPEILQKLRINNI